jgi:hypothetical protein
LIYVSQFTVITMFIFNFTLLLFWWRTRQRGEFFCTANLKTAFTSFQPPWPPQTILKHTYLKERLLMSGIVEWDILPIKLFGILFPNFLYLLRLIKFPVFIRLVTKERVIVFLFLVLNQSLLTLLN